jgi:hypothetical protein
MTWPALALASAPRGSSLRAARPITTWMYGTDGPDDVVVAPGRVPEGAVGFDSSSAMVRAEAEHLEATLGALVASLSSVPGLKLSVYPHRGLLRKLLGDLPYIDDMTRRKGQIQRIVVAIGPRSYWLRSQPGSIRCGLDVSTTQAGQANEEMTFSAWATALFEEIARQNLVNHDSLVALRQLVERDRVD